MRVTADSFRPQLATVASQPHWGHSRDMVSILSTADVSIKVRRQPLVVSAVREWPPGQLAAQPLRRHSNALTVPGTTSSQHRLTVVSELLRSSGAWWALIVRAGRTIPGQFTFTHLLVDTIHCRFCTSRRHRHDIYIASSLFYKYV